MNPAYGFFLPRLTGDALKDERRTRAIAAVIDWWQEATSITHDFSEQDARLLNLINWASVVMIDARTDFLLPPYWNDRPTWGTLRTHAMDGGGLTVRMLNGVASALLQVATEGVPSLERPEGSYKLGLAWHWAILAHDAKRVLEGDMEVAKFQDRFLEPPLRVDRKVVLEWLRGLSVDQLEALVNTLHTTVRWCRKGIIEALEKELEDVEDRDIRHAIRALYEHGFGIPQEVWDATNLRQENKDE